MPSSEREATELIYYKLITENTLENCFPNVEILLRIYLTMMVTNCSGERSFSVLKRVKSYLRSSMSQERLSGLSLLAIEWKILQELDVQDVIEDFAKMKSRRVVL